MTFAGDMQTAFSSGLDDVFGEDVDVRDSAGTTVGSTIQGIRTGETRNIETEHGERIIKTDVLLLNVADIATIDEGYQFSFDGGATWWDIDRDTGAELLTERDGLWRINLVYQADGERASPNIRRVG